MKFTIRNGERKKVLERLESLTGQKARYTRAPRFAYILNGIAVEKDNTLTMEDGADMGLIRTLEAEGYIFAEGQNPTLAFVESESTNEVSESGEPSEPTNESTSEVTDESDTIEETTISHPTVDNVVENVLESIEHPVGNIVGNPMESEEPEETDASYNGVESYADNSDDESETDASDNGYDDLVERIEPFHLSLSFPLNNHTAESVCNLVYTIYSKGKLLSKVTGGRFFASDELVETLRSEDFRIPADVLEVIAECGMGALKGMRFSEDTVVFDGFPETDVKEDIEAWTELFGYINKTAIHQKHIRARRTEEPNEKFAFRTWLIRMGMNGDELKQQRSLMYKRLAGHTAFRTAADERKWRTRQEAKRQELLERKAAAAAQNLMEA